jgi:hypothetical protein
MLPNRGGHVGAAAAARLQSESREMLDHDRHIRQEAKRRAVAALDSVTITSHLANGSQMPRRKRIGNAHELREM